jgi:hypothetical protein
MIRRVDRGRNHWYEETDTGSRIPGVTKATDNGVPKPALITWAANTTAEYAVDNWERLSELAPSTRLKELQAARWAVKDTAANKGTAVHKLAEKLVMGERVAIPDGLAGHVDSYVRFLNEWDVQPVLVEVTVYSPTHGYCGTLDLIADLIDADDPGRRLRWLLDVKTNRSGIYGETALQEAGYRHAEVYVDDDGHEHDLPEVDMVGAVHVRPDGYSLVPLEAGPTQHRQFLYAMQIAQFVEHSRDLVGEPLVPPHTSTYRLVREET